MGWLSAKVIKLSKDNEKFERCFFEYKKQYFCRRVSLIRPAPIELPQDRNVARVNG